MGKIVRFSNLKKLSDQLRKQGKKIVTTNGAFDLFHSGHLSAIKFAKKQGDVLIALINSDDSIKRNKSEKRPIISEKERLEIAASVSYVDYACIFEEDTPVKALSLIKPDIHVKGSEYKRNLPEKEIVEYSKGKIVFFKRGKESTTSIIKKIISLYGEKND